VAEIISAFPPPSGREAAMSDLDYGEIAAELNAESEERDRRIESLHKTVTARRVAVKRRFADVVFQERHPYTYEKSVILSPRPKIQKMAWLIPTYFAILGACLAVVWFMVQ
jgi:hypothetical protein